MKPAPRFAVASILVLTSWAVHTQEKKDEAAAPAGLILDKAETIDFTTDEGTWMSLDVAPDGRMIVFDLLGDIYTMPVAGGQAKRIIGGLSFESQPHFSPDGKKIVYLTDRSGAENVWLADPDGSNQKPLTKGRNQSFCSPVWTPDGQYVIVSKSSESIGTYSLWMYHKEGGSGVHIGAPEPPPAPPESNEPQRPRQNKLGATASPD